MTVDGVETADRVPSVHKEVMEWNAQRSSSSTKPVRKSSTSSVHRVHKKFGVLDSVDYDDSVFVTDQASTILVLYCGGTIGMRSQQGGVELH